MFYSVLNAEHSQLEHYANTTIFPNSTMLINSFLPDYLEPSEKIEEKFEIFLKIQISHILFGRSK